MLIWGSDSRAGREDSGRFMCPQCAGEREFALVRTWKYLHIYFIPIARQELVDERVVCQTCGNWFPITVLVGSATNVPTALDAGNNHVQGISDNLGNVVQFTEAAFTEIVRRHREGRFASDVAVRVEPDRASPRLIKILFDFALADGRDWIGQSRGIPIVVDRVVAPELLGAIVDFEDGEFVRK